MERCSKTGFSAMNLINQNTSEHLLAERKELNRLAALFSDCHARLERMIEFRMDPRLRNRVDPADVIQDAFIEAQRRIKDFKAWTQSTPFVWIRQITLQILIDIHRSHFRQKRTLDQEVRLDHVRGVDNGTSFLLAHEIVGQVSTPSREVSRNEERARVKLALDSMDPLDQEVLALRHFEQLSNREVAQILGVTITAASNRYVRAMSRLAQIVNQTKLKSN